MTRVVSEMKESQELGVQSVPADHEDGSAPDTRRRRVGADTAEAELGAVSGAQPTLAGKAAEASLPHGADFVSGADEDASGDGQGGGGEHIEPRLLAAWREWLAALATNAEAAIAAAHVYGQLAPEARDAWLDALVEDAPRLAVPAVAIYAPLLATESDPGRCERIRRAIGELPPSPSIALTTLALRGIGADGTRVVALVAPLYLSFVRVLWCRYQPDEGFAWARHDAILRDSDAPADGATVEGVYLEETPLKLVIEELAHAILAQRRRGAGLPDSLYLFADLFNAQFDSEPS